MVSLNLSLLLNKSTEQEVDGGKNELLKKSRVALGGIVIGFKMTLIAID